MEEDKKKGWEAGGSDGIASADRWAKGTSIALLQSAALTTSFHIHSTHHHCPKAGPSAHLPEIPSLRSAAPCPMAANPRWGDASSECKAPVTPPTYHMDASLFKFASLTPFHLSIPLASSSLLQNTVYFGRGVLGLRSRDLFWTHQVMNLRDSKLGNPNQVITNWGRMETSTKLSPRGSWFPLSRQCR